jgi:hypothetical protein
VSSTVVEFRMEVPTDQAVQDVKDQIDQILGRPARRRGGAARHARDVEGGAIMTFAVSAPAMTFEELSWFVDDTITGDLQGLSGVGRVDRYGGADREILITLDPSRLDAYGITAAQVSQQISLTNSNQGAGRADLGAGEQAIRVLGDQGDAERLASTTISLPTGQQVRVDSLGTVSDSFEELRSFTKVNGQDVVTFAIFRAKGASEVSVSEVVNHSSTRSGPRTRAWTSGCGRHGLLHRGQLRGAHPHADRGLDPRVLVVLLFLRNWRATFIAPWRCPLSAIPTFWAMDLLGFSLNLDLVPRASRWPRASSWTTPSWRSRTSSGTSAWASRPTAPPIDAAGRDRPRGDRHHLHHHRGLRAGVVHAGHPGAVLQAVRPDGRHRGAVLAAGRAPHHAALAAYFMRAKDAGTASTRRLDDARLSGLRAGTRCGSRAYLTLLTAFGSWRVDLLHAQVPGSLFPEEDTSRSRSR